MDLYLFKHNLPAYERPTPKAAKAADYPSNKLGIRVYADFSSKSNKDDATGNKSADSGEGVDVKRTYFTFTHQFDTVWSAQFQSDIGDQGAKRYDVFVKKAYIQAQSLRMATLRLGSADTPWIPYVEGIYGLRYVEQTITDRLSFGTSADWGFHVARQQSALQLPALRRQRQRLQQPDAHQERRLRRPPLRHPGRGPDPRRRRLQRQARQRHRRDRRPCTPPPAHGRPGRLQHRLLQDRRRVFPGRQLEQRHHRRHGQGRRLLGLGPGQLQSRVVGIFGRYDDAKPSKDLKPDLKETYYNAGLQWTLNKAFAASLVYKYDEVKGGTFSTGDAGSTGSDPRNSKGKFSEIGIYTVYNF